MAQPPSTEWQCFRIKVQSDLTAAAARLLKGLGTEVVLCCQQFHQPLKSRFFLLLSKSFFSTWVSIFYLGLFSPLSFWNFPWYGVFGMVPPSEASLPHGLMARSPPQIQQFSRLLKRRATDFQEAMRAFKLKSLNITMYPQLEKKRVPGPGCRNKFLKKRSKNPGVTRSWMFGLGPISEPIYLQIMGGFHVKSWRCNQRKWGYSHDLTEVIGFLFPLPFDWSSCKAGIIPWLYNKYSIESQWWFLIE